MASNESSVDYCDDGTLFDRHALDPVSGSERILRSVFPPEVTVSPHNIPLSIVATGIFLVAFAIVFYQRELASSKKKSQRRLLRWFCWFDTKRKSHRNYYHNGRKSGSKLERKIEFLDRAGNDYGYRGSDQGFIDDWRPTEFPLLLLPVRAGSEDIPPGTVEREVYLDYAGAALPMKSQLEHIYRDTISTVLGNPHSIGPIASRTAERIKVAERRVLSHLGAGPGRYASLRLPETFYQSSATAKHDQKMNRHPGYDVLFTSGATEAFKIVAERFPWRSSSSSWNNSHRSIFLYVTNSHNSVVGMRELAIQEGATFHCMDLKDLQLLKTTNDWKNLEKEIFASSKLDNEKNEQTSATAPACRHLLVFPSECNFGGDRPDAKAIIQVARASGWYTMLDIAKHASTDRVSLNHLDPDFAALSFYKLFGDPTGVGALLVRRSAIQVLFESDDSRRHYQGGGSVDIMLPNRDYTVPKHRSIGLSSFQNGTSHFRGIANLTHGFDVLERFGGMLAIHRHASCLANELAGQLRKMKHGNGMPVVCLYGTWANGNDNDCRNETRNCGPTVALNVFRSDGTAVGYNEVSKLATLNRPPIQFRTGCFCNPGACQRALGLNDQQAIDNYEKSGHVCGDHIDLANGMPTGAIRISFGKDSIWEDMDAFVRFIEVTFRDNRSRYLDESATKTAGEDASNSVTQVSVSELYLFPIKSCAAHRVAEWPLCLPSGKPRYDREFAIVDTSGAALRLQTCSKLGLISPVIDLETETMRVSAPGCQDLVVRLSDDLCHGGENVVRVCGNKCGGKVWGDAAVSEWFSSFLGIQCWLARYSSSDKAGSMAARSGFSNEQPILLVSENAVATLNTVLDGQGQPTCVAKRFRPNIVVREEIQQSRHCHIEDEWTAVSLGSGKLDFSVEGGCPRCSMVDYDPETGHKGKTLRALASYRRKNGHIVFGIFLRAMAKRSSQPNPEHLPNVDDVWIREGDTLECS